MAAFVKGEHVLWHLAARGKQGQHQRAATLAASRHAGLFAKANCQPAKAASPPAPRRTHMGKEQKSTKEKRKPKKEKPKDAKK